MKSTIITSLVLLLVLALQYTYAQPFTQSPYSQQITGVRNGAVDWGDYDNDGDLDLILIGSNGNSNYSRIYTNNLGGYYTNIVNSGLGGYLSADASWGDYDNDGDLDYAMTGKILSCPFSPVIENIDIGLDHYSMRNFVISESELEGVQIGSIDWGDFDNDGDYDLAILGANANLSERFSLIYENVNGVMQLHTSLTGLGRGTIKWIDIDNDQDLDIFITGRSLNGTEAYILLNNNGVFTNSGNTILPVNNGDVDFGDYDNDGDLDIIVIGYATSFSNQPTAQLYNNTNGIFTAVTTDIIPVAEGSAKWGDYDNDGDLDLLIVGDSSHATFGLNGLITSIYRNDGNDVFVPISHTIRGYKEANARWADHDNDGDLDFILTGYGNQSPAHAADIYDNQLSGSNANIIPSPPTIFSSSINNFDVLLDWNQGSDHETPSTGLSYNIRVGTSPGGIQIVSPQSDLATGYRRKAALGNTQQNSSWKLKNLYPGDYFWSVQSIDGAFAGSVFSPEEQFTIKDPYAPTLQYPYHQLTNLPVTTSLKWYSYAGATSYRVQVSTSADFSSIILDDVIIADTTTTELFAIETVYYWRVQANTLSGETDWSVVYKFTTLPHFTLEQDNFAGISRGQASFGDFDNDNDLDIAIAGSDGSFGIRKIYENVNNQFFDYNANLYQNNQGGCSWADFDNDNDLDLLINSIQSNETRIYKNNDGVFDNSAPSITANSSTRKTAWADIDNDGDLDFALVGRDIYRNNNGAFAPLNAGLANTTTGDLAWGDYDNDQDMDLIVSGGTNNSGYSTRIYRNNNGIFNEVTNHGLPPQTHYARVRWGDVDQDGDLDVLLVGQTVNAPYTWSVYLNNNGSFSLLQSVADGINYGDIKWGDLDNDGDLDVVVVGNNTAYIYMNNNLQFTRTRTLPGASYASVELGDYDNDQDLDILITGSIGSYSITKLFKNNTHVSNTIPNPPTILGGNAINGNVTLSWNKGSDNETAADGLTYNYYFGTSPQSVDISTPMANLTTGKRTIVSIGNTNSNVEWKLKSIPPGIYYWGVQSIDNNYDGSVFSSEQQLIVPCTSIITQEIVACESYTWIDGVTYTSSNDSATWVLTNVYGCDSTIHLDLTIHNTKSVVDSQISCGPFTWIDGITYTSNNNTATWIIPNSDECDSIITLDLVISQSTTSTDQVIACDSYTWIDGITYQSSNNTATWILENSTGCDSIVHLDLTIHNTNPIVDSQISCGPFTWIDGITYTSNNNTATWIIPNSGECDSVITLDLVINQSTTSTDQIIACDSYTWIDGITYTSNNNTATWIIPNSGECDSIITLDLVINQSTTSTDQVIACDSYTWIDGITYTSNNNTATWIIPNSGECDSVITLDLVISQSTTSTDQVIACDSYTWINGITYQSSNNTATWILENSTGCDSIVHLDLTIHNTNSVVDSQISCGPFTWIDGITYTSNNNTATWIIPNSGECDSVITLDLVINQSTTSTDQVIACDSYTWIDGITYTSNNNTATWIIPNSGECDSVITLDLVISQSTTSTDQVIACDSYTWIDGITYQSSNNTATWTLENSTGCDSIIHLDLTIHNTNSVVDSQTSCGPFTWINGTTYYESTNIPTWTFGGMNGCDSTVILNLTVREVDLSIDVIEPLLLKANAEHAQFQWLDCENNFSPIINENEAILVVKNNGSYAVQITQNGCIDTSTCIIIKDVSILENTLATNIKVYPNPTKGLINVELGEQLPQVTAMILDANGKLLKEERYYNRENLELEIDGANASYILKLTSGDKQVIMKIIKD